MSGARNASKSKSRPARDPTRVQSVGRALEILQAFLELGPEVGVSTLAAHVGLNKATVCRILLTLESEGFVTRSSDGRRYRLGVRVFDLGSYYQSQLDIRHAALPHLRELTGRVKETAFLCVREGNFALCIERIDVPRTFEYFALRVGGRLPLHCGGASRVLLAGLEDTEIEHYARQTGLPGITRQSITSLSRLREDVRRIRQQGYALSDEDVTPGICAVGGPVRDYTGQVVGGISISGVAEYFRKRLPELSAEVIRTAGLISRSLGSRA